MNTSTVWQIVDLESGKVFFTTSDSQAERWNNDEQFEVMASPSRRPVAGYTTWMLDSFTDKHSLKLGGVQSASPCEECGHEPHGIICPKCTCMFQVKKAAQASWREYIARTDTDTPTSANCVLCDEPVWEVADLAEFEKNGAHVECARNELYGKKCEEWAHGWSRTGGGFICQRCGVRRNTNGVKIDDSIRLCKCAVRRQGFAICPRCEKPYSADGHVFAGRHA